MRPMENSIVVLPLRLPMHFLRVPGRKILNNRTPISARFGHGYVVLSACREDGGKPCLHKSPPVPSGTSPSTHEAKQDLPTDRYFCMDRLSIVMCFQSKQSKISKFLSPGHCRSMDQQMGSLNYSALSPLTRDLSGLGFTELQNGHVFTTC